MSTTFLTGPAGTGKTSRAVERLRELLTHHVPANNILVIVPHLALARPYQALLRDPALPGAAAVDILTMSGLALQTIDLFWPLVAGPAGFGRPQARPIFLTIETSQYYLKQAIEPLLRQGYFDPNVVPLTLPMPRLLSQILDNLNKAALMGLPHTSVGQRLAASLAPEPGRRVALEHMQACVNQFRAFCLARNLLDFSLRIETFARHLWPVDGIRQFLTRRYRHLIVDNVEEDNPFAHTLLRDWLPVAESALLIHDEEAGYRIFLGASRQTALALADLADETVHLTDPYVTSPDLLDLGDRLERILVGQRMVQPADGRRPLKIAESPTQFAAGQQDPKPDARRALTFQQERFYPQMMDWVTGRIEALLAEGTSPDEIVVLAPFVSDALRFALINRMDQRGLPIRSQRPSRPLSEEPAAKTVLLLARLAFPDWQLLPEPIDVAQALSQAIAGLDLVRAHLLTQVVYRQYEREAGVLTSFEQIEGTIRERISEELGAKFDLLRLWLQNVQTEPAGPLALDFFFSRLFGEILSQPGFGFHGQPEAAQVVANLVNSARKFRQVAIQTPLDPGPDPAQPPQFPSMAELNRAYVETMAQGMMAAQPLRNWAAASEEGDAAAGTAQTAVLIAPATTFLMSNRSVDYQFWLDAGSSGWWERIAQPLTHPYILAPDWEVGRPWTDEDEVLSQQDWLYRLALGLIRRCRKHIFIANAEIGEQGYEQRGQLLAVLQQMVRQMHREPRQ